MSFLRKVIWKKQLSAALLYWVVIPSAVPWWRKNYGLFSELAHSRLRLFFQQGAGWVLVAGGVLLIWRSMVDLESGGGTIGPFPPSECLITEGSYRFCRHPMWLGYDTAALGVILLVGSWGALLVSYPLLLFFSIRFLRREEQFFSLKFEKAYDEYRRRTPFLLPRLPLGRNRK